MIFRRARSALLIDISAHQISVARLSRLEDKPIELEAVAELAVEDTTGLELWLKDTFADQKGFIPAVCGFRPKTGVLRRNASVNPRRLTEPEYLAGLVNEYVKRDVLNDWRLAALNPKDGAVLDPGGPARPALLMGVDYEEVRRVQKMLVDMSVLPRRLEFNILPLIGGVAYAAALQEVSESIVVCEIGAGQTHIFILGKDGVHTPEPINHGLDAIVDAAQKEFALSTADFARIRIEAMDEELLAQSRRLVRPIARQLKPAVDYYELQTGLRVGGIFCANLPAKLAWIGEALSAADKLNNFQPDCVKWSEHVGIRIPTDGSLSLGPRWIGPLSQIARLSA